MWVRYTHTPGIYRNGPEQNWGAWSRGRRLHISENEPPNAEWCLWPAIYTVFMGHYNNVLIASLMWIYLHRMNLSNPNVCLIWTFSKYTDTHIGHTHTITNAGRMLRIEYNQIYIYIYILKMLMWMYVKCVQCPVGLLWMAEFFECQLELFSKWKWGERVSDRVKSIHIVHFIVIPSIYSAVF